MSEPSPTPPAGPAAPRAAPAGAPAASPAGGGTLRRTLFRMPAPRTTPRPPLRGLRRRVLGPLYRALARARGVPGLDFHRRSMALGRRLLRGGRLARREARQLVDAPMDSVRYFEFGTLAEFLAAGPAPGPRYLDVSSPRLFPLLWIEGHPAVEADLVNPDAADLELTRRIAAAAGLDRRCRFHDRVVDRLDLAPGGYDLVTSISVLEHIPGEAGLHAFARLWELVAPGGRLLVTVPCAREPFEEWMDRDVYGVLQPDERGETFGSLFVDEALLAERYFRVAGPPSRMRVHGERAPGLFERNRDAKVSDHNYPWWREPLMMAREWRGFPRIADLPGLGVVALEWVRAPAAP